MIALASPVSCIDMSLGRQTSVSISLTLSATRLSTSVDEEPSTQFDVALYLHGRVLLEITVVDNETIFWSAA